MPPKEDKPTENPQDAADEDPSPADLGRVIDNLGFGCAQITQICVSGGMWMADASEFLILSSITKAMADDWGMKASERSAVVSIVFFGVLIGNFIAGKFGDYYGRRMPILASLGGLAVFNILTLFASGFVSLAIIRFFIGVSIGFGQPAQVALSMEISPTNRREDAVCGTQFIFGIGELYAAVLVWLQDPNMVKLDWRQLVVQISIPCVIFFFACLVFLHESPRILALQGRDEEAKVLLAQMQTCNGRPDVSLEFTPIQSERQNNMVERWWASMKIIFGRKLLFTTLACCFSCFSINSLYVGTFYAFPLMLPDMKLESAPAVTLISTALFDFLGQLASMVSSRLLPRRTGIVMFTFGQILSLVVFLYAAKQMANSPSVASAKLVQLSMNGIKFFTSAVFCVVFIYYSEIYPTVARSTGFGTTLTFGRIGAICAPMLYEYLHAATGSSDTFFYIVMVATIGNFGLFASLRETKDLKLEEHFKDDSDTGEVLPISATRSF